MSVAHGISDPLDSDQVVSYRKRIQLLLKQQDAISILGSRGQLIGGVVACLAVAIVGATAIWATLHGLSMHASWSALLLSILAVLGVLIVRIDRRTRTDAVVQPLTAELPQPHRSPVAWASWPVRAVVDGAAGVRGKWKAHQTQLFRRCAQVIVDLAKFDGGVEIRAILHPPEDLALFDQALLWLDRHQWVGESSDGSKIWLSTEGRSKLESLDLLPSRSVRRLD